MQQLKSDPVSIIVPAHNEAAGIRWCLAALTTDAAEGELEVIVVANACEDDTAEIARSFGRKVQVIETAVASKTNALNLGERAASGRVRVYIDADVCVPLESVRALVRRLSRGDVLAVAPRVSLDLDGCSWPVRAFYQVDAQLPSHREGIGGSGVYALSQAGRDRFNQFPAITADDAFVRRHFKPNERCTVDEAFSMVSPPRTLKGLVAVKTRSHFGNYEINKLYPHLTTNRGKSNRPTLLRIAFQPEWWSRLAVYAYVKGAARIRSLWRYHFGDRRKWERDHTTRLTGAGRRAHAPTPAPASIL